jgi:hypothetical protein
MRTFIRAASNLILLLAALGTGGWLMTQKVYRHASHDHRTEMLAGVAAGFFVLACLILAAVPSKAKLARRSQARRPAPYAPVPAKRR